MQSPSLLDKTECLHSKVDCLHEDIFRLIAQVMHEEWVVSCDSGSPCNKMFITVWLHAEVMNETFEWIFENM